VQIAELYYDKLPAYMPALYQLTLSAIQQTTAEAEEDEVGQQAVEFWSTVCDEEIDINEEAEDARLEHRPPARTSQNFVPQGAAQLVPLLLEAMCKQEDEDVDDDTWNTCMAGSMCLAKVALAIGDDVVGLVTPFIDQHIQSPDWRRREAAALAFGSLLEGPSVERLTPFMGSAIDVLIRMMADPSVAVKDTAAWALGRICEHHTSFISPAHWSAMIGQKLPGGGETEGVLLVGLKDHPRVAANVCFALFNLADQLEGTRDASTNGLSASFVTIARGLLAASERGDASENNLRCSAYESLNLIITNAAQDTVSQVEQLLPVILKRLEDTFSMQVVSNDDREAQRELQGLLCGTLQVITQKLEQNAAPFADRMMQTFLQLVAQKNSTVQEEALMAVGAVATATEGVFEKYMPHFRPFLSLGLSNYEEHSVCQVAVGVLGDVCRALEAKVLPYCDEMVQLLLRNLQNPALNRNVKPAILSCFGDIALAIGKDFEKYMSVTMTMLVQASGTTVDMSDPDMVDYLNQLRVGIFEAYTGILTGLRGDGTPGSPDRSEAFEPYLMEALGLSMKCAELIPAGQLAPDVLHHCIAMLGDLASSLGQKSSTFKTLVRQSPHQDYLKALLKAAKQSPEESTKEVGKWASRVMDVPAH
jgi:importin subunit beta-1